VFCWPPFGLTELGAAESSLELSLEHGITVLVGEVALLTDTGRKTLAAGMTFTIDGIEIEVKKKCDTDADCAEGETCGASSSCEKTLTLAPMEFVLLANPKQVQIKRAGTSKWRAPKKREALGPGDAVRTRRASGTKVQFGTIAGLTMKKNTEMLFNGAGTSDDAHRAQYQLVVGNVMIHMSQDKKIGAEHQIEVAGLTMKVAPGLKEAAIEVIASGKDKATIKVRFGRVILSDGTTVDAGTAVTIVQGKVSGAVRPVAFTRLDLRPRSSSIVYYSSDIPPIEFGWSAEKDTKGYEFEVASDRKFTKKIFRENLKRNSFVYDRFGAGRYYWRVKGEGDWVRGVLSIQKKSNQEAQIKRKNTVIDSGEKTVIYYQKALPSLAFKWTEVAGAAKYRLKIYPDGEFENPLIDEVIEETSKAFGEGKFAEGKYYWHQVALDGSGKDIRQGRMNTLNIAYDNAIIDLSIKSPRPWQKVSSKSVTTKGEVQLGARLTINGRKANLDGKGRFREALKLNKGSNQIIYRTVSSDGIERYYVRNVYRR